MDLQNKISRATIESYTSGTQKVNVSYGSYIGKAFDMVKSNLGTHVVIGLLLFLLNIVGPFLSAGYFMGLFGERKQGKKIEISSIFDGFQIAGKVVWVYLLSLVFGLLIGVVAGGLMVLLMLTLGEEAGFLGMLLIYLLIFLISIPLQAVVAYATHLMVFSPLGGQEAIMAALKIARKNIGNSFMFGLIYMLVMLLGVVLCYVGAIFTYPIVVIAAYLFLNDVFGTEKSDGENSLDDTIQHLV